MSLSKMSWKTTLLGLSAVLVAGGHWLGAHFDDLPETVPNTAALVAAVLAGIGLCFARDNTKTSEMVSAK